MSKSTNKDLNSIGSIYGDMLNQVYTIQEKVNEIGDAPLQDGGPLEKRGFTKKNIDLRTMSDKEKKDNLYNINKLSEEDEEAEEHMKCKHAEEGCDCDECAECKKNQRKEEDEEGRACWKGYKKVGTKEKDGKTVNNCVKEKVEENLKENKKIIRKSLNNFMSKKSVFEKLYENVMGNNFNPPGGGFDEDAKEGSDLDALGVGDAESDSELEDQVTFTLDRTTAQTLIDVLQGALGDMEDEGMEDDDMEDMENKGMGEEDGEMYASEEDEEDLGGATQFNTKYNDGKNNKVSSLKPVKGTPVSKYTDKVGMDGDYGHALVNANYRDGKSNKVGGLKTGKSMFEQ